MNMKYKQKINNDYTYKDMLTWSDGKCHNENVRGGPRSPISVLSPGALWLNPLQNVQPI